MTAKIYPKVKLTKVFSQNEENGPNIFVFGPLKALGCHLFSAELGR